MIIRYGEPDVKSRHDLVLPDGRKLMSLMVDARALVCWDSWPYTIPSGAEWVVERNPAPPRIREIEIRYYG